MDAREAILARLVAIADTVPNVKTTARNNNDFADLARPALVILDGDEEADVNDPETRPPNAPRRVAMKAELVILASGTPDTIGTTMNALRAATIKAIQTDALLIALVWDGGVRQSIRYNGATLSLQSGRAIEAEQRLDFSFVYVLSPDQL